MPSVPADPQPPGAGEFDPAPSGAVPPEPVPSGAGEPVPSGAVPPDPGSGEPVRSVAVPARRRNPLIYFWVYSLARVSLYLVLWGLLWLFGLGGLIGAAVALLLSIPLSFVLLARPRAAMTGSMMERLNVRQERTAALDEELSGGEEPPD